MSHEWDEVTQRRGEQPAFAGQLLSANNHEAGKNIFLVARPKALTASPARLGMSKRVIRSGGTHGIEAPINRGCGVAIFPEMRTADKRPERGLGTQPPAHSRLLVDYIKVAHAAAP